MSTSSRNGPYRIVLLNCGKFDFADVELGSPVHLVGPNNVGKTSLIALLQFLYIDDQRKMQFSREMRETRRYYFPDKYSFALFECLTPGGFQVVGVHGLGPVRQYDFERFVYSGRLEVEDYLDGNRQPREPEEVFRQLSLKELKRGLEPQHLRAALTGVGESRDAFLGLVPAQQRNTYYRFRKLFGNVLRLSHVRQEELKQLLLDIYHNEFQQREIDLAKNYAGQHERVVHDSQEVQELKRLQAEIERLLDHLERRDSAREVLPGLWKAVGESYESQKGELDRRETQLDSELQGMEQERSDLAGQIAAYREESGKLARRSGALEDRLERLAAKRREFEGFVPEWKRDRAATIRSRLDDLARRLGNAKGESVEELTKRLRAAEKDMEAREAQLRNLADAAVNHLRAHLADDEIAEAFAVLNPDLLSLPVNTDEAGVRMRDPRTAADLLRELLVRQEERVLRIRDIEIDLDALSAPLLGEYSDPDLIREQIEGLKRDIQRYSETLDAARRMEALRKEKTDLEEELTTINRELDAYRTFQEQVQREPEWREELEEIQESERALQHRIEEAEERVNALRQAAQQKRGEQKEIGRRRADLRKQVRDLSKPEEDWVLQPVEDIPAEWDDLVYRYEQKYEEQRRQGEQVQELLDVIDNQTYGRYTEERDEAATIQALREELESIPERERAVEQMWKGIAVGIKKDLQNIGRDLDTLKGLVSSLNRDLGRFEISNLASLKLVIVERQQWVRRIRDITVDEEMPLFGSRDAAEDALEAVGRLLKNHPRVDLKDLFELTFEVGMPDGSTYRHEHLDAIESNGTTIAIKVLVNLTLLREVLGEEEVQVPFYLDECSSLDRSNLMSIVSAARRMGFVAVLASPDAMDVADRVYYIEEQDDGRVILEPETAMVEIRMRNEETTNPNEE